jgi:hypothetical protein
MTEDQIKEYETIDSIRRKHVNSAEKKCRKLRKGNIPYSPVIQQARNKIEGWSLLLKSKKGLKVSSRKLSRTLKKAGIPTMAKADNIVCIKDELDLATKQYYTLKKRSKELRETHLESLASALASAGNLVKQNVLKQLRHRESQRATAKKIKFIQGKLNRSSTIIVTETLEDGTVIDITDKRGMEKAIIHSNKKKFKQSFSTPFYNHPYNKIFGYLGLTKASGQVLAGTYIPPATASSHVKDFLQHVAMPLSM